MDLSKSQLSSKKTMLSQKLIFLKRKEVGVLLNNFYKYFAV